MLIWVGLQISSKEWKAGPKYKEVSRFESANSWSSKTFEMILYEKVMLKGPQHECERGIAWVARQKLSGQGQQGSAGSDSE